jgi:hypothetical protein
VLAGTQYSVIAHENIIRRVVMPTTRGVVRGRRVVLATGLRGSPRMLGVPGQELPKVAYRLIDPEQYAGQRVLVVGGGDSALEAAIQLAENGTGDVSIAYRGPEFARCRPQNKRRSRPARPRPRADVDGDRGGAAARGGGRRKVRRRAGSRTTIACLGEAPTEFGLSASIRRGDRAMPNPALGVHVGTASNEAGRRWRSGPACCSLAAVGRATTCCR